MINSIEMLLLLLLLLFVTALIGPAKFLSPTNRNGDGGTCLGARRKCENDVTCKVLLDTVSKVCDESTDTCETTQRLHCISVLTTLQSNPYFRGCTCDPLGELDQYRQCRRLRTLIFAHLCIRGGDHATIFSRHGINNDSAVTSDRKSPDNLTCLEAKKKCGLDSLCLRLANDLRIHCRESRSTNQCVAQDWHSCYSLVSVLFSKHRYLADCWCPVNVDGDIKEMCEKVKLKIMGNACIGSFLLSMEYKVLPSDSMSYEQMLVEIDRLDSSRIESGHCTKAFSNCHKDVTCRSRAVKISDTCRNTSDFLKGESDRRSRRYHNRVDQTSDWCGESIECSESMERMVVDVRPNLLRELIFCNCERSTIVAGNDDDDDDDDDDDGSLCRAVMATLVLPTCSLLTEIPHPSCSELLKRCNENIRCSSQLNAFSRRCVAAKGESENETTFCKSPDCIEILSQMYGTFATRRCSCKKSNEENDSCEQSEHLMNNIKKCFDVARSSSSLGTWFARGAAEDDKIGQREGDCHKKSVDGTRPVHIKTIRKNGYCADVCRCHQNQASECIAMPCLQDPSCSYAGETYMQGSNLEVFDRGHCKCYHSEFICPKADQRKDPKAGLFLHLGYSENERNFLLRHFSADFFSLEEITKRLHFILNEEANSEKCNITIYQHVENNIMYEIQPVNGDGHIHSDTERIKACIPPARRLNQLVNTQDQKISKDIHLSVVRVSQLEKVTFFDPGIEKESMTMKFTQLQNRSLFKNGYFKNYNVHDTPQNLEYLNQRQSIYNDKRIKYNHKGHHQPYTSACSTFRIRKSVFIFFLNFYIQKIIRVML